MDKQDGKRIRRPRRSFGSGNTHRFTQNDTKKTYQAEMEYMVSGLRYSPPFTRD